MGGNVLNGHFSEQGEPIARRVIWKGGLSLVLRSHFAPLCRTNSSFLNCDCTRCNTCILGWGLINKRDLT